MTRRSPFALIILALAAFACLVALGAWQLQRRVWKMDLIARVENRVHAAPVASPSPDEWGAVTRDKDEYRRVRIEGAFIPGQDSFVQAVTRLGPGYWAMTPLKADAGFVVLINRGFAPARQARPIRGHVAVTGLLRITEPKGGFLRANDPAAGRWYSRDVAAIAAARRLANVAPYFIDADAGADPGEPIGGLTVIAFPNSHLIYAIIWYGLALMVAGGVVLLIREGRRPRQGEDDHAVGR